MGPGSSKDKNLKALNTNANCHQAEDQIEWILDEALTFPESDPEEIRKARRAYRTGDPDAWWKVEYVYNRAFDNSAETYARLSADQHKCCIRAINELKSGKSN